MAAIQTT